MFLPGGGVGVAAPLVAHQGAEVSMVILQLLLEEGDGGWSVQDDPRLRGYRARAAAVRTADSRDGWGPERRNDNVRNRGGEEQDRRRRRRRGGGGGEEERSEEKAAEL